VPFKKSDIPWWKKVQFAEWHLLAPTDCTDCIMIGVMPTHQTVGILYMAEMERKY